MKKNPFIRFPFESSFRPNLKTRTYRIRPRIGVKNSSGVFPPLPFILDTGSSTMVIPVWMAKMFKIPFSTDEEVTISAVCGKLERPFYRSPVSFCFLDLPTIEFQSMCLFNPYEVNRCLLSLSDFVEHFTIRSHKESKDYPEGAATFQLRSDHGGVAREHTAVS